MGKEGGSGKRCPCSAWAEDTTQRRRSLGLAAEGRGSVKRAQQKESREVQKYRGGETILRKEGLQGEGVAVLTNSTCYV